ncbi:alpha/beta fold hydrolase [Tindallia californiensis]|uniref:Pimeloyl-ACP methyl ester carboxylesterase n=1 Tax=Tindallia californiensis TaxID=159292 RepID=A0A1H3MGA9_9FIRM|nr:alpha/beta hydrolase [Tindallia californiensis]SDY75691.1 Pimeloyl-ACP methyl ester carboxylesterase [Tindallia californiensis]
MKHPTHNGDLYFEVIGPEAAPVLVFTHGAGLNHQMFGDQVRYFSDRYRCLIWDLPGHGNSYRLKEPFRFTEMPQQIMGMLDAIGAKKATLVGQSMGSMISQYTADLYPDRVEGIISIGGSRLKTDKLSNFQRFMFKMMPLFFRLVPEKKFFYRISVSKAITPAARTFYEESLTKMGRSQFFHVWRGLMESFELGVDKPISHPLLILHGEHESPANLLEEASQWNESSPNSRLVILSGAGHNANMDAPKDFNQEVAMFLNQLPYKQQQ